MHVKSLKTFAITITCLMSLGWASPGLASGSIECQSFSPGDKQLASGSISFAIPTGRAPGSPLIGDITIRVQNRSEVTNVVIPRDQVVGYYVSGDYLFILAVDDQFMNVIAEFRGIYRGLIEMDGLSGDHYSGEFYLQSPQLMLRDSSLEFVCLYG